LDFDDEDKKKKKLEEHKAEVETLTKLMKKLLGGKVERVVKFALGGLATHSRYLGVRLAYEHETPHDGTAHGPQVAHDAHEAHVAHEVLDAHVAHGAHEAHDAHDAHDLR
jgi:hypothetical protein